MSLTVDTVTGVLELQDKWNSTLDKAAANTKTFEANVTAVMTKAGASTDQMAATTIALQGRLAVAEAASRSLGREIGTLAADIVEAGGATADQAAKLNALTASFNRVETAAKGFKTQIAGAVTANADFGTAAGRTIGINDRLQASLGRFDGILASLGVNIGTEIRALTEMASASGQTIGQLGLLSTAGIAAGTAIGVFGLTRAALDFLGVSDKLDKSIANVTARLLRFGDVAAETAGAKQDVINKAVHDGADANIQYADAIAFNTEKARAHNLVLETSAARIAAWNTQIDNVRKKGEFAQLTEDIQSQAFSAEKLEKRYNLSAEALAFLKNQMKAASDDAKALNGDVAKLIEVWAAGDKIMADFAVTTHKIALDALRDEAAERKKQLDARNRVVLDGFNQIQQMEKANAEFTKQTTLSTTDYQIQKIREWEAAQIAAFKGTAEQLAAFTTAVQTNALEQFNALQPVVTVIGGTASLLRPDTQSQIQAGKKGGSAFTLPSFSLGTFSISGARATGGPVTAGESYWVGEHKEPELFTPGVNGVITPMPRQPVVIDVHVDARGAWFKDSAMIKQLARDIGDEQLRSTNRKFGAA